MINNGKNPIHMITFTLLVIGGLNWLAVGLLGYDMSTWFGGMQTMTAKVIYILVGLSAIAEAAMHKGMCGCCNPKSAGGMGMQK